MLPLVFNAADIIPVGLIGPVGVGKTQYFKGRSATCTRSTSASQLIRWASFKSAWRIATLLKLLASHCHQKTPTATSSRTFTKPPLITKIEQTGLDYGIILIDELLQAGADVQKVLADVLDPAERTLAVTPSPTAGSFASPATVHLTSQALPVCSRTCSIVRRCLS